MVQSSGEHNMTEGGFKDDASAMAIDGNGNVFVTGLLSNGTDDDYVTLKLDGTNGSHISEHLLKYSVAVRLMTGQPLSHLTTLATR